MKIYIIDAFFYKNSNPNDKQYCIQNSGYQWISGLFDSFEKFFEVTSNPSEADIIIQLCHEEYAKHMYCPDPNCSGGCGNPKVPTFFKMEYFMKVYGSTKKYAFYIWDLYSWAFRSNSLGHANGGSWFWERLKQVCKNCDYVFVPNYGTKVSVDQYCNIKSKVLKPFTRFFEEKNIQDNNYVAIAQRRYVLDHTEKWLVSALKELNIPYIASYDHETFFKDSNNFKKLLTDCSFIVSAKFEVSTGGISLLEAYNCGKPVLISDSKFNGANDIFGDRAFKFKYYSYEHLKECLNYLWKTRPKLDMEECKNFCKQFTSDAMVKRIYEVVK
tara:strand:+ start:8014 stop:8997 length:984 start_codon:yes stop_codon:yes gene_type:complete